MTVSVDTGIPESVAPESVPEMVAVCSARPRPSVQNNHSKGSQWWARDVYHLRDEFDAKRARCGRDCSEWLVIGPIDEVDDNCCARCLASTVAARKTRALRRGIELAHAGES